VQRAPGFPCALCFAAKDDAQLGRIAPRDRGLMWSNVIARSDLSAVAQRAKAEATKQSRVRHSGAMQSIEPGIQGYPDVQLHI